MGNNIFILMKIILKKIACICKEAGFLQLNLKKNTDFPSQVVTVDLSHLFC